MVDSIDIIWQNFAKKNLPKNDAALRKGTNNKKAAPWVNGLVSPALPTTMLSSVTVYESWLNQCNMGIAKDIIALKKELTVRELVYEMLYQMKAGNIDYPYIWWVWPHSSKTRVIHQDSNGVTFVKLGNKWQMAFSIQSMGVLVGAQGAANYEELPKNAYFVSWENEEMARAHML